MQFAGFHDNRLVERLMSMPVGVADEDAKKRGFVGKMGRAAEESSRES